MPCVDNKNLIYNIKELPETYSVAAGDMLIIETDDGTNIMDFNNFVIGLDNTTFGTTITQHSSDIANMYSEFDALSAAVETSIEELSASTGFGDDTVQLSESGYQILPSGLIMQWGLSERADVFQQEQDITFPIAFPTGCLNVVGTADRTTTGSGGLSLYISGFTTTTATFVYDSDGETFSATAIRWQAFGY